jgi:hypothetical protein
MEHEIVEGMARALFVSAYADCVESWEENGGKPEDRPHRCSCGEDWMDYAPPTSTAALDVASMLADQIEKVNCCKLGTLYNRATKACKNHPTHCESRTHTPEYFGHYLAMQALGSGVAWTDNHESFLCKVGGGLARTMRLPYCEFYIYACDMTGSGSVSDGA